MKRSACVNRPGTGVRITTHRCDVSDESQVLAFRDAVQDAHETDHINLLFNNAGIGGGGSFIVDDRAEWERTFGVCWFGVYYSSRAFMPLLVASTEGYIVNTSSVNGFWATLGPSICTHCIQRGEVCGEGFLGSARDRSAAERAARQSGGRDAGTHRHVDCDQHRQGARTTRAEGHERGGCRDDPQTDGRARHAGGKRNRRSDSRGVAATGRSTSATRRRSPQRKRRTSFSTACATIAGGFSSATTRIRSTAWCAKRRSRHTKRTF